MAENTHTKPIPVQVYTISSQSDLCPNNGDHDEYSSFFTDALKWLTPVMNYLMVTKKSNKSIINYLWLSINITFIITYFISQFYLQITGWHLYSDIINIIWCFFVAIIVIARFFSIVYSYKYFNRSPIESYSDQLQQTFSSEIKRLIIFCKWLYISLPILYIITDIIILALERDNLLPYYKHQYWVYIFVKSIGRIFVIYPQLINVAIQSVIVLKFYLYLNQFYDKLETNLDAQDIFENYDQLFKLFEEEYHWSLRYAIQLYFFAEILFFWDSLSFTGFVVMVLIIFKISMIFVLYFYTGSILESVYTRNNEEMWKNGKKYLNQQENNENNDCKCYYNYFLQYMSKYPIYVTFGSIVISKWNVIKFCSGLIITRGISYALEEWLKQRD